MIHWYSRGPKSLPATRRTSRLGPERDLDPPPPLAAASALIAIGGADPRTADIGDSEAIADIGFAGIVNRGIENSGTVLQDTAGLSSDLVHFLDCPEYSAPEFQIGIGSPTERTDKSSSQDHLDAAASRFPPVWAAPVLDRWWKSAIWSCLGS